MKTKNYFSQYRQEFKGIYIATRKPDSKTILAKATNYRDLEKQLERKKLSNQLVSIQYLEPKSAICAYGVSLFT